MWTLIVLGALCLAWVFAVWLWERKKRGRTDAIWDASADVRVWPWFAVTAGVLALLLFFAAHIADHIDWLEGLAVEGGGCLFDVILFGVILSLVEQRRDRLREISHLRRNLEDWRTWEAEEGVLRKVSAIRSINRLKAELPPLAECVLPGAKLERVYLKGADLSGADLSSADLRRALLSGADLAGANLASANLTGADLSQANLTDAFLAETDLTETRGLVIDRLMCARDWQYSKLPDYIAEHLSARGWCLAGDGSDGGHWLRRDEWD
jgi:hypothetical protein